MTAFESDKTPHTHTHLNNMRVKIQILHKTQWTARKKEETNLYYTKSNVNIAFPVNRNLFSSLLLSTQIHLYIQINAL